MAKPKIIRRPVTDINGIDIFTGEKVDDTQYQKEFAQKSFQKFLEVRERIRATEKNGMVMVSGLGRVSAF